MGGNRTSLEVRNANIPRHPSGGEKGGREDSMGEKARARLARVSLNRFLLVDKWLRKGIGESKRRRG